MIVAELTMHINNLLINSNVYFSTENYLIKQNGQPRDF